MTTKRLHWMLVIVAGIFLSGIVAAAAPRPLTDSQLDSIYAGGVDVSIALDIDLSSTDPNALFVTGGAAECFQQFLDQGMTIARNHAGSRSSGSFDPNGQYTIPDPQNFIKNGINLSGDALKNSSTLTNVFALNGDVAVAVNFLIIVNPAAGSSFNISQSNANWSTVSYTDAFSTLNPGGSN